MEKPFVLLADDNEATCTLVRALLQREFTVGIAVDGTDAVEKLRAGQPAAILLDLRMPILDGFGVLDFLRNHRPELIARVIVLTAALSKPELERVREYDVCAVVAKPFEVELLLDVVRDCAGKGGSTATTFLSSSVILLIADLLRH